MPEKYILLVAAIISLTGLSSCDDAKQHSDVEYSSDKIVLQNSSNNSDVHPTISTGKMKVIIQIKGGEFYSKGLSENNKEQLTKISASELTRIMSERSFIDRQPLVQVFYPRNDDDTIAMQFVLDIRELGLKDVIPVKY